MRNHTLRTTVLSFIVASALMVPITAGAQENRAPAPAQGNGAGKSIEGKVTAVDASGLTVDGTKFAMSETTTLIKAGLPIKFDDIKVGDKVRITLSDETGSPRAVSVEVVTGGK
jgi:hypothetical protein